jgi:nucleoside-triphosphatase THEP1
MTARGVTVSGSGWERLAQAVAQKLPAAEVDGIWIFSPIRRDSREWGTAILSRLDGERRRIYTARYVLAIKGKERGKFESTVQEVGTGPVEALARLVQEAQTRIDDEQPPVPVLPESWFSAVLDSAPGTNGAPG